MRALALALVLLVAGCAGGGCSKTGWLGPGDCSASIQGGFLL